MATKANATIAPFSAYSSKEEEIQFYRAVVESIPEESYLHQMFAGTVEYVERAIRNDHCLVSYIDTIDAGNRAVKERNALSVEIDRLKAQIAEQNETIIFAAQECENLGAAGIRERDARISAEATIARLEAELTVYKLEAELSAAREVKETIARNLEDARGALAALEV